MQEKPGGASFPRPTRLPPWAASVVLFAVLALLNGVIVWPLLVQDEFTPGEFKQGSFDVLGGKTTLFLDDQFLNELYPLIDLYAGGQLAIPAGYSAAFPLRPRVEYRVRVISSLTAPYIVLGAARPLPVSTRLDRQTRDDLPRPPNPEYLVDARILSADTESRLEPRPWNAARPWRDDARWLADLTSICGLPNAGLEYFVRTQDDQVTLQLGRCVGQTTLTRTNGAVPMMAVLTGPNATVVEKNPEPWGHRSHVVRSHIATLIQGLVVLQAGVAVLAVGFGRGLVITASLALASLLFPFEAAVVWLLMGVLGVVVAFVRLARRVGSRWGVVLTGAILAVALFSLTDWHSGGPGPPTPRLDLRGAAFDASHGSQRCLLTGYSTVADAGLHYGTPGIFGLLDTTCTMCAGRTTRVAWRGGSFSQIQATLCADEAPIGAGQDVIFLGSVNDDFQLPLQARSLADRLRGYLAAARIMFSLRELPKTIPAFDALQTLMVSVEMARRNVADQTLMIRRAVECADGRDVRFWFFHDYLASDLAAGPSPGRAFLRDQRRAAVESSQGRFVNLLEVTADRAGVSWFNDIVHLSAIGHNEVEQVICATLLESDTPPSALPSSFKSGG